MPRERKSVPGNAVWKKSRGGILQKANTLQTEKYFSLRPILRLKSGGQKNDCGHMQGFLRSLESRKRSALGTLCSAEGEIGSGLGTLRSAEGEIGSALGTLRSAEGEIGSALGTLRSAEDEVRVAGKISRSDEVPLHPSYRTESATVAVCPGYWRFSCVRMM